MIVHATGIPLETHLEAYEFQLPLNVVHGSCEDRWGEWAAALVGKTSGEIQTILSRRLDNARPEFHSLASRIPNYDPFAILFYGGMPHIWASRDDRRYPDSIYIPPPATTSHLSERLANFADLEREQIRNFISVFGGIGQRYPWEAVEFDRQGTPCDDGLIRLLHGDDSTEWAMAVSGAIKHYDNSNEWREKKYATLQSFLREFTSHADVDLFEFAYH